VSLEDWLKLFEKEEQKQDEGDAAALRSTVLKEYMSMGHVMFSLDTAKTREILEDVAPDLGSQCPAVDAKYLFQVFNRIKKAELG
jgi:hypothetical protein